MVAQSLQCCRVGHHLQDLSDSSTSRRTQSGCCWILSALQGGHSPYDCAAAAALQVPRIPQLRLDKFLVGDTDNVVLIGSTVTYQVEVTNVGNAAAPEVVVTDTLQAGQVFAAPVPEGELLDCCLD